MTSGVKDDVMTRARPSPPSSSAPAKEYEALSPTPKEYDSFVEQISHMWASQPNWTDAQLKKHHHADPRRRRRP